MRAVIIEVGGSHDECIPSIAKFLKTRSDVHLLVITTPSFRERIELIEEVDDIQYVDPGSTQKVFDDVADLINENNSDLVILNSANGKIKRLAKHSFPNTKFHGLLHTPRKIGSSFGQRKISSLDNKLSRGRGVYISHSYLLPFTDYVIRANSY